VPTVTNVIEISASPEAVWAVLADLPATRHWLPGVIRAHVDGDVRVCQMADGQEVHERITDVSADHRRYRFEHLRVPLPVRQSSGTFAVTPSATPDTAVVTLTTSFEPLDPTGIEQLADIIERAYQRSLESLRRYLETKQPWDAS